ncbi:MAG: enoyl-CoA hydratase family protein [Chloroflexi bacterium]|nr:enoyl-CoA hydratase family protein [Chloroflexota bacterium]
MTYESILLSKEDGIATIRFNRPATLNSLTFQTYRELERATLEVRDDKDVRVLVITGQGRGFCSGGDVNEIIGQLFGKSSEEVLEFTRLTCRVTKNLVELGKPSIAAINGIAAGAGSVIASACDIRIAAQSARFAFLFVRVGLSGADMGIAWLLPRLVGTGKARELLLTGDILGAQEAERIGLVNRVVADGELETVAVELARKLAKGPPIALKATKELLDKELTIDFASALELDAYSQAVCLQTEDHKEGYRAFLEKREPQFKGI